MKIKSSSKIKFFLTLLTSLFVAGIFIFPVHFSLAVVDYQSPVAINDEAETTSGETIAIDVLANDYDPNSNPIKLVIVDASTTAGGSASINDNDTISNPYDDYIEYTAPVVSGASIEDTFAYEITDTAHESGAATVTVIASPLDD